MEKINELTTDVLGFFDKTPNLVPVFISIVLGAVLVIWGYKLFRLWLFAFGAQSGFQLGHFIVDKADLSGTLAYAVVVICVVAIAILFWVSLKFSFSVAGFALGAFLAYHYAYLIVDSSSFWVILVGGILGALLASFFIRLFIVAGTSIYGAFMLTDGLYALINKTTAGSYLGAKGVTDQTVSFVIIGLTLVFIVLGFIYQYNISDKGQRIKVSD